MSAAPRCGILAVAGVLVLSGCTNATDGVVCTAVFVPGLVVEVHDSASGATLGGARGAVHDAAYVDSLHAYAGAGNDLQGVSVFQSAGERAGTYTLEIVRSGYRTFTKAGIVVTRDACHVQTQQVRAALVPIA